MGRRVRGGLAFPRAQKIKFNRRYQNGLSFTGAYTFAKNITDTGGPNPNSFGGETGNGRIMDSLNRSENRANDYGTRRNRFIGTVVYELPFGKGRAFMHNGNHLADAVLGGWRLSSIFLFQTGPFITPSFSGGGPSGTGAGLYRTQRPDRAGSGNVANQDRNHWLDRNAFVCPGRIAGAADQFNCRIGINPASD